MATVKEMQKKTKDARKKAAKEKKELTRAEINKRIAKLLGYEVLDYDRDLLGNKTVQWRVPSKYRFTIRSLPVTNVPDFVAMIEFVMLLEKTFFRFGFPRDYNTAYKDTSFKPFSNSFATILKRGITPEEC